MDWLGFSLVLLFYGVILGAGIWVARSRSLLHPSTIQELMLAGRTLGLFLGIFSLVATEVGGAFVNGTAEEVYNRGLIWCIAPVGYSLSMTINGLFFVDHLASKRCVTCIDILQMSFGKTLGALVYLPSCLGDVCWTAAVLTALGSTLSVITEVHQAVTIIVSAGVAILYTLVGGMYSVAYTDVIQVAFIFAGLWLAIPFILLSESTNPAELNTSDWIGSVDSFSLATYVDLWMICLCGGIPWQPYYQRALALKSTKEVRYFSIAATLLCLVSMIPSVVIGAVSKSVEWSNQTHGSAINESTSIILPASLSDLVPYPVGIAGLAAVSAAAMSSIDSSLLSGASYLTHNLYANVLRPTASNAKTQKSKEYVLAFRLSVIFLGLLATLLSLASSSIYGLWILAGDLGYVIVFPQFVAAVHFPQFVNPFGSAISSTVSVTLRLLIGEPSLDFPGLINFPTHFGDPDKQSVVPVKTILMLTSLCVLIIASYFGKMIWPKRNKPDRITESQDGSRLHPVT